MPLVRRLGLERSRFRGQRTVTADVGNWYAARRLAELLAERGDVDQAFEILCADVIAGDENCSIDKGRLVDLLAKCGRGEEAERLRRFGLNPDGSIASGPGG